MSTSPGFFTQPVFILLLLAGCSASRPDDNSPSSARGDTLSSSASLVRDTPSAGNGLSTARAEHFEPDGYYFIEETITIDGRRISWLELNTVEVDSGGEQRDGRPKLLQPPEAFLSLSVPGTTKHSRHQCAAALITPDSLSVRCVATPVGEVTINGHFLDKRGNYSDKYAEKPTVLLVARVVAKKDGKITHDAVHRFSYSSGD